MASDSHCRQIWTQQTSIIMLAPWCHETVVGSRLSTLGTHTHTPLAGEEADARSWLRAPRSPHLKQNAIDRPSIEVHWDCSAT